MDEGAGDAFMLTSLGVTGLKAIKQKRTWRIILYTLPKPELKKMGLISLSSL
jgi:hypothetical protein